jgi:Poly(R)-hydroxyalkanoic acid synthase subunit (PHA_synth_III_E)
MESAATQGGQSASQQAACGNAWERFGRLLQAILSECPAGAALNNQLGGARLAAQFERWWQDPGCWPPWWQMLRMAPSFAQPPPPAGHYSGLGFGAGPDAALSIYAPNAFGQTCQPLAGPMMRWSQLQAQLALHWSAVARNASERFVARVASSAAPVNSTTIRKLYDEWIECAEQAYAATVHTDEFCRTQAELVNIMTTLVLQVRQQGEGVARMFGFATRSEVEALRQQVLARQNGPRPGRSGNKQRRRKGKAI